MSAPFLLLFPSIPEKKTGHLWVLKLPASPRPGVHREKDGGRKQNPKADAKHKEDNIL